VSWPKRREKKQRVERKIQEKKKCEKWGERMCFRTRAGGVGKRYERSKMRKKTLRSGGGGVVTVRAAQSWSWVTKAMEEEGRIGRVADKTRRLGLGRENTCHTRTIGNMGNYIKSTVVQ